LPVAKDIIDSSKFAENEFGIKPFANTGLDRTKKNKNNIFMGDPDKKGESFLLLKSLFPCPQTTNGAARRRP
jgi:hypothetical protein